MPEKRVCGREMSGGLRRSGNRRLRSQSNVAREDCITFTDTFALLLNPYNTIAGGGASINVPVLQPENRN